MKVLFVVLGLLMFRPVAQANEIIIMPGDSRNFNRTQLAAFGTELIVRCQREPKCTIKRDYVGKKYGIKMPNGKNYKFYKTKEAAISGAATLVQAKVCDRLVIDEDSKKMAL